MTFGIAPYFAWMGVFFLFAHAVGPRVPGEGHRFAALDGLRGILALSVFFHHAMVHYHFRQTGTWGDPPERFYAQMGPIPVMLFFFLSGFLFWSKLIAAGGKLDYGAFFIGRARRILPAYWLSVALILAIVAWRSNFSLHEPVAQVAEEIGRWLSFSLPWGTVWNINAISGTDKINAAVAWTLRYEWLFYFSLPLLAPFARGRRLFPMLAGVTVLYFFLRRVVFAEEIAKVWVAPYVHTSLGFLTYLGSGFGFGMIAAWLVKAYPSIPFLARRAASLIPLTALALAIYTEPGIFVTRALLLVFFVFVVYGNDFFGVLTSRAAATLGAASYSIYVLHGIVLTLLVPTFGSPDPLRYWLFTGAAGLVTVSVGLLSYRWVECPFIRPRVKAPEAEPISSTELPERKLGGRSRSGG